METKQCQLCGNPRILQPVKCICGLTGCYTCIKGCYSCSELVIGCIRCNKMKRCNSYCKSRYNDGYFCDNECLNNHTCTTELKKPKCQECDNGLREYKCMGCMKVFHELHSDPGRGCECRIPKSFCDACQEKHECDKPGDDDTDDDDSDEKEFLDLLTEFRCKYCRGNTYECESCERIFEACFKCCPWVHCINCEGDILCRRCSDSHRCEPTTPSETDDEETEDEMDLIESNPNPTTETKKDVLELCTNCDQFCTPKKCNVCRDAICEKDPSMLCKKCNEPYPNKPSDSDTETEEDTPSPNSNNSKPDTNKESKEELKKLDIDEKTTNNPESKEEAGMVELDARRMEILDKLRNLEMREEEAEKIEDRDKYIAEIDAITLCRDDKEMELWRLDHPGKSRDEDEEEALDIESIIKSVLKLKVKPNPKKTKIMTKSGIISLILDYRNDDEQLAADFVFESNNNQEPSLKQKKREDSKKTFIVPYTGTKVSAEDKYIGDFWDAVDPENEKIKNLSDEEFYKFCPGTKKPKTAQEFYEFIPKPKPKAVEKKNKEVLKNPSKKRKIIPELLSENKEKRQKEDKDVDDINDFTSMLNLY